MVTRRSAPLPRAVIDLEDYTESQNWLVYGETGSGKTPWCSFLPNLLILAVDNQGTISAQRAGATAKVWPVHRWADFVEAYKYVRSNPFRFDWVMVDTVTMAQTRLMRDILTREFKRNPAKRGSPYIAQIQDHLMWQQVLKSFVMDFNELPVNMIWTAQAMDREDAEGYAQVWPLMPGGKQGYEMAAWLIAQMHVIGYMSVKMLKKGTLRRPVRSVLFDKIPPYQARDRYGVLPKRVVAMDGDKPGTTIAELTSLISEAPTAVKERAAKRIAERDDSVELDVNDVDDTGGGLKGKTRTRRTTVKS